MQHLLVIMARVAFALGVARDGSTLFSSFHKQCSSSFSFVSAFGGVRSSIHGRRLRHFQSSNEALDNFQPSTLDEEDVNGLPRSKTHHFNKYLDILEETGLSKQLHATTLEMPPRKMSKNDVFCNREIKMQDIRAIGFDMDYTLAQYKEPQFDKLAFDGAVRKLVTDKGYPEPVLNFTYNNANQFWIRGLIMDTQRGNFLKIDRHKYVRVAYHGFQRVSSKIRKSLYMKTFNKIPSFSEKHFVNLDTLFQHVDAHLFASLIDMKDAGEYEFLDGKTYEEIYKDVRACVDLCHRDGVIKDVVAERPEDFIVHDPDLVPMLQSYRDAGVKVFLLTNSYWEYTAVAMNYLFHGEKVPKEVFARNLWLDLFDLVIVGSCKPAFLVDPYLNLFRVNPQDGGLRNTDGVFEIESFGPNGAEKFLQQGKVFQGGNWLQLQAMLRTQAGEEILYVGDHLYSDVLRSKRTLGWRTALIVPELTNEMAVFRANRDLFYQIVQLRKLRDDMNSYADGLKRLAPFTDEIERKLSELDQDDIQVKNALITLTERYHRAFHLWGQMFVSGYQDSRFAFYVENYACLYTSKATNLGIKASPERAFRTAAEMLPHDKMMADFSTSFED